MNASTSDKGGLGRLAGPPDGAFPSPPVTPVEMSLPFGGLSWENFERLCYRLALKSGTFDHAARYGRAGQNQSGIDVYARTSAGRYEVWQAKRYRTYGVSHLRRAVTAFLTGDWVDRTETLVVAVQASLDDTTLQDEIERQAAVLAAKGVRLQVLGGEALIERLRPHQDLVLAFFGRVWLKAFYGDAVDPDVRDRLDGAEYALVRDQLARLYRARFSDLDQGVAATRVTGADGPIKAMPLLERYAVPDVFVREKELENRRADRLVASAPAVSVDLSQMRLEADTRASNADQVRRRSVADWLSDGEKIAVIADAGAGKSTLLRAVALDLLSDQSVFPALASRWGDRLPIVISFAKWARATADRRGDVGLKELVELTLQPFLTVDLVALVHRAVDERRIVLIVDGLDEWSAEQAARTTLQTLLTFVQVHEIPTIVSGRPHGLNKIGALSQAWKTAELAPLSPAQQKQLALTWFGRLRIAGSDATTQAAVVAWEAERFLKELQGDSGLGDLAETPLLFMGLLLLAVRDVALPRNRVQALQSLVALLLEAHPEARATAAGEVAPRFDPASTPEVRQSAVAALAYSSRRDGGDAGYSRAEARRAIRDHLVSDAMPDAAQALAVADEILAVNAETVGLIVEKAPGDVGFAHASLEEYLGALHVHSWRFNDLLAFVTNKAGDPRWRNVLCNLVAINTRPSEIDDIVAALEGAQTDVAGDLNRRQLLAELAFSPSRMSASTALRLAHAAFAVIEGSGLDGERVAMTRVALQGLSDPVLQGEVERRLRRWAPRHDAYPAQIYSALATWPDDGTLLSALCAGLGDEAPNAARAAALGLAARFGGQSEAEAHLHRLAEPDADLAVAAAAIEALVRGWPEADLTALIGSARASRAPVLQAAAIWARTFRGDYRDEDLADLFHLTSDASPLDFRDRDLARESLTVGWPDDDRVVEAALDAVNHGHRQGLMDLDLAYAILLRSTPGRAGVKAWILKELEGEFPFNSMIIQNWEPLLPFAEADDDIREALIAVILSGEQSFRENYVWPIIAGLRDTRLRDYAIAASRKTESHSRYWNLLPLVRGWADDPEAHALFQEMIALGDDQIDMVASLLPELYGSAEAARARLIRIAANVPKARRDLIVQSLQKLGCDHQDEAAVQAFLPYLRATNKRPFEPVGAYLVFAGHPQIREAARGRVKEPEAPIAILARAFPDEPDIAERALAAAHSLPASLRAVIAAASGVGADRHPVLAGILAAYDEEVDFHLRVQLSIDQHRLLRARGQDAGLVNRLAKALDTPGPDFEERRAAAFAGLVVLDAADRILTAKLRTGTVRIGSYIRHGVSGALSDLIVEKWSVLRVQLGDDFIGRIIEGSGSSVWPALSRYVGPSAEARRAFLDWCAGQKQIGFTALRSLADLWPGSDVLHGHALSAVTLGAGTREALPTVIAGAEIIRDQFPASDLRDRLRIQFSETRELAAAIALAILDPSAPELRQRKVGSLELGLEYGEWLGAVQITVHLEPPEVVAAIVHALAEREAFPGREHQPMMTAALLERLSRDEAACDALRASLETPLSPTAFAASASLLAAAGKLDAPGFVLCAEALATEREHQGPPTAVFDLFQDAWRSLSHVMADLLQTYGV